MSRLHRASYEVPLWHMTDSLHLEALCQQGRLILISVVFCGITQAVYYPPPTRTVTLTEMERGCRLAIHQFRASGLEPIREERRNLLRRPVFTLEMNAAGYDGVLLSKPLAARA